MGCRQTKETPCVTEITEFDPLTDNGVTTIPSVDPRLPLNARQVFKLKQSWKGIKRKIAETGVEMFVRLFKSNADLMAIFDKVTNIESEDELRQNEYLEQHATLVMTTLDEAITKIDDYDHVKNHLNRTGATHQRFDVFRSENFRKIREPFIEAVKITLGDRYTDYMANVYEITIDFILKALEDGFLDNNNPVEQKIIVTDHSTEQPEVTKIEHCRVNDVTNKEQAKT
ncbi:neuroglobin-like [Mizuhopecten yessoensis]|uniref:Neuroglobin n=1 Tax=Mizuhopecten yessoensis TaxID=6573 RepID=A0A210PFA6_MIZYE|nr:neuroglobin-like [Mizuhopecten yessoensis]OWF35175.1 Neuroglobin [Mizuhopecten yessoensis]